MDEILTPEEICKILKIKMSKFRSSVFQGQLPVIRLGRLVRIRRCDLEKWIEEKKGQQKIG